MLRIHWNKEQQPSIINSTSDPALTKVFSLITHTVPGINTKNIRQIRHIHIYFPLQHSGCLVVSKYYKKESFPSIVTATHLNISGKCSSSGGRILEAKPPGAANNIYHQIKSWIPINLLVSSFSFSFFQCKSRAQKSNCIPRSIMSLYAPPWLSSRVMSASKFLSSPFCRKWWY